jgi:hypothetical protein
VYLITAYPKNEKDDLTRLERKEIAKVIVRLEHGLEEQRSKPESNINRKFMQEDTK